MSEAGAQTVAVAPPPPPPLPSNLGTPPASAASIKTASLKTVSGSPSNNAAYGKPPASPGGARNAASPYSQKREASRDKIRSGL